MMKNDNFKFVFLAMSQHHIVRLTQNLEVGSKSHQWRF